MMGAVWAALVGCVAGLLAAFGVGGGTLLLLYLTMVLHMEQHGAQGINLLFFLFAAGCALPTHLKSGQVAGKTAWSAILAGSITALVSAWLSARVSAPLLRRLFGLSLCWSALQQLRKKDPPEQAPTGPTSPGEG